MLFKTHSELYKADSFTPLLISGLLAPEYSLFDALKVQKGSSFSSRHMQYDEGEVALIEEETVFATPVIMMMGKHDMTTSVQLAEEYYEVIEAPYKELIIFEESAHFPFFEEPERFTQEMIRLKKNLRMSKLETSD